MYRSLDDCILGKIINMTTANDIWVFLNEKCGAISNDDDVPKVEAHEDVEHDHKTVVVEDCSTSSSSDDDDLSTTSSLDKIDDDATSEANSDAASCTLDGEDAAAKLAHEELSVAHDNLGSSFGSNDQCYIVANPCDVGKKHVSTSCDDLLSMSFSLHLDACSTSMYCETNLLKENNELNEQVKNLSNKLERCYNSKVTFEHILKTQRNYGDKCGLSFKKMTKGERKQEKKMKNLEREKLSHLMCYQCHEVGHLANSCTNKEKLKKIKEEERVKHVKWFKCRTWSHLTSMCPTKQLGGRARHPMQIRDAKMMSKNEDKKKAYAHIKCFECKNDGHFALKCPTKLEKKAQATLRRQGNGKQHMSKEEKAQSNRSCYLCQEIGHMAHSCSLGNSSKPISINNHHMLRKDGDGTSMVAITKHPAIHTKAMPKHVAPNLRGPKLVWVPSKGG
ncbi:hypothetical protein SORBI_3002G168550 [Sorghum bicolor]|uniref:CCHC-type domain-containing protein n=1 Tax=Sorghum bicolor TaxID=4558 RepID=A0A1W0W4E4_SORBI|nr:hypothetical protein SORBI_3002G168550 [Sorghum bicolor]